MISVGIDIGTYSIKIAELQASGETFRLNDYSEIFISEDPSQDKKLILVDALRRIAAHYQGRPVKFTLAVPQDAVATRLKTFPFKEKAKILKSMPFQLSDEVPFDHSTAVFDAHFIGHRGKLTDILAYVCPKQHVEERITLSQDVGIEPELIVPEGSCYSGFFQDWQTAPPELPFPLFYDELEVPEDEEKKSARGLLSIGHTKSNLMVFVEGHHVASRSLFFGGRDIARAISLKYDIPEMEGLNNLRERGFILLSEEGANKDQIFFSNVISESLKGLTNPLQRVLLSISTEINAQFSDILMVGGVSQLMNLGPYLTQELEIPCNPFRYLATHSDTRVDLSEHQIMTGMTATGLALEGLRRPRNPSVNLRKNELAVQSESLEAFWSTYKNTFVIAACLVLTLFVYGWLKSSFAESIVNSADQALIAQAKAPGIDIKRPTPRKINTYVRGKKKELAAKQEISKLQKIDPAMDIIADLSRKMPSKTQVTLDVRRLVIENDNVIIEGEVSQAAQVTQVVNTLRGFAIGGKTTKEKPTINVSNGKIAFAYSFKMDRTN